MLTPFSVNDALHAPSLEDGWSLTLSEWEGAAHTQIQATLAYVRGLRNQVLNVTRGIDSMEELEHILALCYIDLKCQWSILNMQIQYAVAHRGEIREDLMYRASCVTHLLEAVEALLSQKDVDAMTELISQPVGSGERFLTPSQMAAAMETEAPAAVRAPAAAPAPTPAPAAPASAPAPAPVAAPAAPASPAPASPAPAYPAPSPVAAPAPVAAPPAPAPAPAVPTAPPASVPATTPVPPPPSVPTFASETASEPAYVARRREEETDAPRWPRPFRAFS